MHIAQAINGPPHQSQSRQSQKGGPYGQRFLL
nr:MAG TPA: hypothetical protein [Bacteriophage sp.]